MLDAVNCRLNLIVIVILISLPLLAVHCAVVSLGYPSLVAKPNQIELPTGEKIAILYEDRSVIAIDKPRDWMLVPFSWQKTNRNLQAALTSSIAARDFWARSRNLRFLRFIHRLDADTTGILLLGKSPGAVASYGRLFESRKMEKVYLAVVEGTPREEEWTCRLRLAPNPGQPGRMKIDPRHGKDAETRFRILASLSSCSPSPLPSPRRERRGEGEVSFQSILIATNSGDNARGRITTLVEARPLTGRTHQIRVHLFESGYPIVGDELYGSNKTRRGQHLALRAVALKYPDPFTKRQVKIRASSEWFLRQYGFDKLTESYTP